MLVGEVLLQLCTVYSAVEKPLPFYNFTMAIFSLIHLRLQVALVTMLPQSCGRCLIKKGMWLIKDIEVLWIIEKKSTKQKKHPLLIVDDNILFSVYLLIQYSGWTIMTISNNCCMSFFRFDMNIYQSKNLLKSNLNMIERFTFWCLNHPLIFDRFFCLKVGLFVSKSWWFASLYFYIHLFSLSFRSICQSVTSVNQNRSLISNL